MSKDEIKKHYLAVNGDLRSQLEAIKKSKNQVVRENAILRTQIEDKMGSIDAIKSSTDYSEKCKQLSIELT